jgi:hypothetical protein
MLNRCSKIWYFLYCAALQSKNSKIDSNSFIKVATTSTRLHFHSLLLRYLLVLPINSLEGYFRQAKMTAMDLKNKHCPKYYAHMI